MSRHRTVIRLSAVLVAVALAKGCGDGDTPTAPPTPEPARPTTVAVSPATAEVTALGATVQLTAEVRDQNANVMAGVTITWTSSAVGVATVDAAGLVTGVGAGMATITATAGSAQGTAQITVANPDRAALVALYHATDGPNWVNAENWLTDASLGEWYGVDTDGSGRVVRLHLSGKYDSEGRQWILHGLKGPLPPQIGNLAHLTSLDLAANELTGVIPPELGNLTSLRTLRLRLNSLWGPIPPELGNLASLRILNLGLNSLRGAIPSELGNLTSLTQLDLSVTRLSGPIPPELGNLTSLERLSVTHGQFEGPIPRWLGNLANLRSLNLIASGFTGPIPREFGNLASLEYLGLSDNALKGPIPESLRQIEGLETFWFSMNTGLCAPGTSDFVSWLDEIEETSGSYCNESDAAVLKALYDATNGPRWTNRDGWPEGLALEEWHGVTTDPLGRVTGFDLSRNGLAGRLSQNLGSLARMTVLRIGGNALTGRLPQSLMGLSLSTLHYAETELCAPGEEAFQNWLDAVPSHEGASEECAPLSDREILETLYDVTDGPSWNNNDNWFTDAPLGDWYGVRTDPSGRVEGVRLWSNNLTGPIPPELGNLTHLTDLLLFDNNLTGPIPPELGELANLTYLELHRNNLTGPIPPELGELTRLRNLWLSDNNLTGLIPPELSNLTGLWNLELYRNHLSGSIPSEFGGLANLKALYLFNNDLTGQIPPELGNLTHLTDLLLFDNNLTGPIPPEFGNLTDLRRLRLNGNNLWGQVPPELGNMSALELLTLSNNREVGGALPTALTDLPRLESLMAGGTDLCAPQDPEFRAWLAGVDNQWIRPCGTSPSLMAYLTQAVQSWEYPVPLVAGKKALLRVFATVAQATTVGIPPVRARFYLDGTERHLVEIPAKTTPIPTELDEGSLSKSSNAVIDAELIQPGLEMVIEIDPDNTLDPGLGVAKRIPETGRMTVEVGEMPLLDLTVIPFLWSADPNRRVVEAAEGMAADPEGHELLWMTHTLLPVRDLKVTAHEPVLSSSNNKFALLKETTAIRAMEGGTGYYMGMMSGRLQVPGGVAALGGRTSFSSLGERDHISAGTMAHELGHNLRLSHAPCGNAPGPDPDYPNPDGYIGSWGYDFRPGGGLVASEQYHYDLMSYCTAHWISAYHFTNALRFRLSDLGRTTGANVASRTKSLLLWGGVGTDTVPYLEPAFVVEAPPKLPNSAGEYRVAGRSHTGVELFSLSFTMPEVADGDGSSSFAFTLPVRSGWESSLAAITLTGPGGSVTLDGESNIPIAILRSPRTGQVRGILRDFPPATQAARSAAGQAVGPGLEVLFSRGIPDAAAWQR